MPLYREPACVSLHLLLTLTYDPIQAHPFALRKRAARSENDNDDVSPTEDRPLTILTLRAAHTNDDDDDVSPRRDGDDQLDAAIALIRKRTARVDDDDEDVFNVDRNDREAVIYTSDIDEEFYGDSQAIFIESIIGKQRWQAVDHRFNGVSG